MAQRKSKRATSPTTRPAGQSSPASAEAELDSLAAQARHDSRLATILAPYLWSAAALAVLGVASVAARLALSPVYGGIPSSVHHAHLVMAGCFVGWAGNVALRRALGPLGLTSAQLLPAAAAYVPLVQFVTAPLGEALGPRAGAALTGALTLVPVTALTAASVADRLDGAADAAATVPLVPRFLADAAPGLGSWAAFRAAEALAARVLDRHVGEALALTRVGLEVLVAAAYGLLAPSRWLVLAAPALLHTALLNTHVMTPGATAALNATLGGQGWVLLDRRESVTGYVSVLESVERGFRVMRCDHSLLGGQWTVVKGEKVSEPIYGVFAMLEAVRLVEGTAQVADADASALVVGLGIGTTPSALVTHGIDTTVVEIDPVVHEFAARHFDLKENNEPVIADAVAYTAGLVDEGRTFDYIVHDVFTGGAEPVDLFTREFLTGLSNLLKPTGVIAINYAGDFSLPAPRIIVRTIAQVFPACRLFRESPAPEGLGEGEADFTNMVIFCRKEAEGRGDLRFRQAVAADFLQSRARQAFLQPRHEVRVGDLLGGDGGDGGMVLLKNDTGIMTKWHETTAAGHWRIMRTVLPPFVWEMW